jgi:uncharacterized membrane protein YhdT
MHPHHAIDRLRQMARWGIVAKGIVYLAIGFLSASAAVGFRRAPADSHEAVHHLFQRTHSELLLWTLGVALAFYAGWRLLQALTQQVSGQTTKPWWRRLYLLFSASVHGAFSFWIVRFLMLNVRGPSNEQKAQTTSANLFSTEFGSFVAFAIAAMVAGMGLYQFYRSFRGMVKRDLQYEKLSPRAGVCLVTLGRLGEIARGLVLCTISGTIFLAVWRTSPGEVRGFSGALQTISQMTAGHVLLFGTSVGLMSLGLFLILSARYQKM